ncbi:MAG: hypothetical protein MZV70_60780 [Desulfobacterales bacterium]|nr:hypothetical protein [Desulfobacterales bacterium]
MSCTAAGIPTGISTSPETATTCAGEKEIANVVFFPLYPLLVRLAGPVAGGDLVLAGWMLSSLFLVLAVVMLTRLMPGVPSRASTPTLPAAFLLALPARPFSSMRSIPNRCFCSCRLSTVFWALRRRVHDRERLRRRWPRPRVWPACFFSWCCSSNSCEPTAGGRC